ncbi:MAG: type II toxin-antitoxin system RelE/ParE family toxin [Stellaceae bacterium]
MSSQTYRLTASTDADINDILGYTLREFGPVQFEAYWRLIDKAGQMVGKNPTRPGSRTRDDLGQGIRSFHIEVAAARSGAASHILYYVPGFLEDGSPGAVILRVLWEGMEPKLRIAQGLG